jgi:5-oxoprolinase (ATP-hydrolysing) subunit C
LRSLSDGLRDLSHIELNLKALQTANIAGHAVSAVDAATWQPPASD